MMSNTPAEINDHLVFFRTTKKLGGSVLINGLGLGVALKEILTYSNVKEVTVIEKSKDVINLVAPYYEDPRLNVIHADALEWKAPKGKKYTVVWHDIWAFISTDNLETMGKLHRKYGSRCEWQGSWCRGKLSTYVAN